MNKLEVFKNVGLRPISATSMLWNHRRTLRHLWRLGRYQNFWNHIFTTYFIRGEDCGKGVLDPIWKLTGKAPFLWDMEMETTTACYLKCIHCEHTYWKDKSYLNQHLSINTFKRVLDYVPNLKWINLTGEGTSILNPYFAHMVFEVKSRGIYLDFSHDFHRLPDEVAKLWVSAGVDRIYWSIDATTKETYEKIRVGANFDTTIANVQKLLHYKKLYKSPLPEICFRFAFFKDNAREVITLPALLASLVDDVKDYGDEPSINFVALLEFDETKGWEVELDPQIIKGTDGYSKRYGFKNYWSHISHLEEEKAPMDYCTFWSEPYIMITGHVVPCCAVLMSNARDRLEKLAFGSIYENTLEDIWNTSLYRNFRKMVVNPHKPVPAVCVGCRAFNTRTRLEKYGVWEHGKV